MREYAGGSAGPRAATLRGLATGLLVVSLVTGCGMGGGSNGGGSGSGATFDSQAVKNAGFADPEALRQEDHGITVTGAWSLSERAVDLTVETDAVSPDALGGRKSVVVIAPENFDPSKKYPVVYMLPGSSSPDASALQWYETGKAEQVTQGLPVITVIMSGGQQGWYTDWATQDAVTQNWESFHVKEMLPWVDSHLPTAADRDHRVILGNSMGGYGAIRYAEERPDLFGEAISLSGLLDLSSDAAKNNLVEASRQATGEPDAVFGDGRTTTQEQWQAHDPLTQSPRLKDVHVQLFAGRGNGQEGDIEPALRDTTATFARELDSQGIPRQYTEYGRVGDCDGGHIFECWSPAAVVALGRWAQRTGIKPTSARPSVAPEFKDVTSGSSS
ncbi:esterase [Kocuria tytonicola]|uniref:Esterase n=1 Tax=Kocuria tytonicola TaxID=2055946 RepID=A0A3L9L1A5_9MICC|nr:alpha/beta hydrolase-fold protein [Kocuria tytonicola]RLY91749.1 esterase [Kocuria tytonicola]